MNTAYVYLQLYKLFDDNTPLKTDCGRLCGGACCKDGDTPDSMGMYLFPGEKKVFELLSPDWIKIEASDFYYTSGGVRRNVPIAFCSGSCDRYQRPLSCRIFPLTPYTGSDGKLRIITDPRAKSICPLAAAMRKDEYNHGFVRNVERTFRLLMKNRRFADFMKDYSAYLSEYLKFFNEE